MADQHRKQVWDDKTQKYVPVPEEAQVASLAPESAAKREFQIGDAVHLAGRVLEVQSPQGGQTSVKVQLPHAALWLRGEHLTHTEPLHAPTEETEPAEEPELEPEQDMQEKQEPEPEPKPEPTKALSAPPEDKMVKRSANK